MRTDPGASEYMAIGTSERWLTSSLVGLTSNLQINHIATTSKELLVEPSRTQSSSLSDCMSHCAGVGRYLALMVA